MNGLLLSYFAPKNFEEKLYSVLAVDKFVQITPLAIWARISGKNNTIVKSKRSALKYFRETLLGEVSHLTCLIFLFLVSCFAFSIGDFLAGIAFIFFNLLVNLYPIFLMRHNRLKIAKTLRKDAAVLLAEISKEKIR